MVIQPPFVIDPPLVARIFEPLASFLSLQKLTLFRDTYGGPLTTAMVKRVIGIPGDTVRLTGFVLSVRPRGGSDFIPEQQLAPDRYPLNTALQARGWSSGFPLSGQRPGDAAERRPVLRAGRQSSELQ